MTTPAMNFVAVCANANIPLSGDKKLQLKHLRESGIPLPSPGPGMFLQLGIGLRVGGLAHKLGPWRSGKFG